MVRLRMRCTALRKMVEDRVEAILGNRAVSQLNFTTFFNGDLQLPATEMQWAVSVATGIFGGAAPFIFYLEATRRIPTTTVSQFSTLVPVIALIGGVVFLNDVTTPVQLLGTAIVVVSLSLLARYARAH